MIIIKTIGIILRDFQENSKNFIGTREDLFKKMYELDVKVIGIPINNDFYKNIEIIKDCDGIILSGGDAFKEEDFLLINYLYENDIPTFGICLGMQSMARFFSNMPEVNVLNHKLSDLDGHFVNIDKNSLLYKIINKEKIFVNSRHKSAIVNTDLFISARSDDNIIEAVEDVNKKFFLGVEWHPESLNDSNSKKLFNYFINIC